MRSSWWSRAREPIAEILLPVRVILFAALVPLLLRLCRLPGLPSWVEPRRRSLPPPGSEPSPEEILSAMLPRYVETRVFQALLESAASEHAARRRAMSAATENADDLIKSLTRVANQARQTEITSEIMEIVGAAEALGKVG